jgi:phosphatidylserine/phosphatidylglycerophosphate/cardiolipin synthase-like enzyme
MSRENPFIPEQFQVEASPLTGSYFFNELITSINNAKYLIYSVQYQWKWNVHERFSRVQQLGTAIINAKKRNVEVKVILNQESPRRNISKINSITNDELSRSGVIVKMLRAYSLLHTKLWIIDGLESYIGSHNISGRSLGANEEVSVKIVNKEFAKYMLNYFDNLWNTP